MFRAFYIMEADVLLRELTSAFRNKCWVGRQTQGKSRIVLVA